MELLHSLTDSYSSTDTIERYGILDLQTKTVISYRISMNRGDGIRERHTLELQNSKNDPLWLVNCPEHALWVLLHSTEWYNAGYSSPSHSLEPDNCAIVKVVLSQQISVQSCAIPSDRGFFEHKYKKHPQQFAEAKSHIESGRLRYDLFDFCSYLQQENGINPELILNCRPAASEQV
ncbi:hypothetical protein ACQ4M3_07365 [Leptolyngbya sp. AN03gr2]|uniref:hypothetical protein n=1 Tax=unclassified Leptolyngbya TaxID=2650499 RepID=UPI003D3163C6